MTLCNLLPLLIGLGSALIGYWIAQILSKPRIAALETELEEKTLAHTQTQTELGEVQKQHSVLVSKFAGVEAERKDWEDRYHVLFGRHNDIVVQHDALIANHTALDNRHQAIVSDFDALGNKHNQLISDFDEHKAKTAVAIAGMEGLVGDWTAIHSNLTSELSQAKAQVGIAAPALAPQSDEWQIKYNSLSQDYLIAKGQIQTLEEALDAARKAAEERVAQTETRYLTLKTDFDKLSSDSKSNSFSMEDVAKEKESAHQALTHLALEKNHLARELEILQGHHHDLNQRYHALVNVEKTDRFSMSDWEEKYNELLRRYNYLENEHRTYLVNFENIEKVHNQSMAALEAKYNDLNTRHESRR